MITCKSILLPLATATLFLSLSDPAFAAPGTKPSGRDAAVASDDARQPNPDCQPRSFGPSHHGRKRIRPAGCAEPQRSALADAERDCRTVSHGPRHVAAHARRSACTTGDAPLYTDAAQPRADRP